MTDRPDVRANWVLAVGGLLALVFSLFGYYTVEFTDNIATDLCRRADLPAAADRVCRGESMSAWHGFFGWFAVLLLLWAGLTGALASARPELADRIRSRAVAVGAAGAGLVATVVAMALPPGGDVADLLPRSGLGESDVYVVGPGPSYWVILAIAVVMTAIAAAPAVRGAAGSMRSRRVPPPTRPSPAHSPATYPPPTYPPPTYPPPPYPPPNHPPPGRGEDIEPYRPAEPAQEEYFGPPPMIAPPGYGPPQPPQE